MELDVYKELTKIWSNITTQEKVKDISFDIRMHKKLLDIFQVGEYYYLVNNVRKSVFELVSPEVEAVLGYTPEQMDLSFYVSLIHPDDLPVFLNYEAAIENFFNNITGNRLFRYKVQYDIRMKRADGQYVRILTQYVIFHHDADNVRTFVIQTDISHLKKDPRPILSFIGMDNEPSYLNVDVASIFRPTREIFTRRERDILRSLAKGMSSAEISEAFSISKHTVDSHRKNMLKKTQAKSTNEMIGVAFNKGWI